MVSITGKRSGQSSKDLLDVDTWLEALERERTEPEIALIRRACETAQLAHFGQYRLSGEPYFQHVLAVANIVAELQLDSETVAAAFLHDVAEDTSVTIEQVREQFGDTVARLVDGVTKMKLIQAFKALPEKDKKERSQAENLRKMLLAMAEDVRVVLIKLADRTHNMRTLAILPEDKRLRIARETLDIFAPLANRLGIWQLKWELEDLSFRYLDPALYKKIAGMLDERRTDREEYIHRFSELLRAELEKAGIKDAVISGRPKHIFSIWRKMERKQVDYNQIYDVRGLRILVRSVADCYTALGVVHSRWQFISGEFDDYIATPKENNYRSIHTAVIGPEGKTVEVQIRTHQMHEHNELGVAAHWRYKEGGTPDATIDNKINLLRQLLQWKDEISDATEFVEQFRSEVFEERVYVFTPQGKVIDMRRGATPLDFAYHIHTELGHRCRGAKVNGRMVPLTYTLQTGEQVEILTVKAGTPSRDWLNPHLGYVNTPRARAKIQNWFRQLDRGQTIVEGREILERELRRLGATQVNYDRLASELQYNTADDLFVAIAHNDIKQSRYIATVQRLFHVQDKVPVDSQLAEVEKRPSRSTPGEIRIHGIGNLLSHLASCCSPVPGDDIRGYITQGRGISVHRSDCPNILRNASRSPERVIPVEWGTTTQHTYPVEVEIQAFDRHGLLRDISAVLANERIAVTGAHTASDASSNLVRMQFTIEIPDLGVLSRVLAKIAQLPNILEVRRAAH